MAEPPRTFGGALRHIGPGLILAGAIVGSGELIAATLLGAENGYSLLWLIAVSCGIKVFVQHELGRYTIASGETGLQALDRAPGPRWRVGWAVWLWCLMIAAVLFSVGGLLGAVGEVAHRLAPQLSITAWSWLINGVTVVLLIYGGYGLIEKVSITLVVSFTAITVAAAFVLTSRPEAFSWAQAADGFRFAMPEGGLSTAATVFGATGVGAGELLMYPYWCLEKGYARFTGPHRSDAGWRRRAQGWIGVMGADIAFALLVYTMATLAFYLLGAGVLHPLGLEPRGMRMVDELSNIYTATLGAWSLPLFLVGAVAVFYSSVFSATAAHSRQIADFLGLLKVYDRGNAHSRRRVTQASVIFLLGLPAVFFTFLAEPVAMVKTGGVAQALMLPVIGFTTVYLRYRRLPAGVIPHGWITLGLWVSSAVMLLAALYYLLSLSG